MDNITIQRKHCRSSKASRYDETMPPSFLPSRPVIIRIMTLMFTILTGVCDRICHIAQVATFGRIRAKCPSLFLFIAEILISIGYDAFSQGGWLKGRQMRFVA
jgi:hypothetical protein